MQFPGSGIAANALSFARTETGAEPMRELLRKKARFFLGATLAALALRLLLRLSFSRGRGRLPPLRQHRGKLAAARHLRGHQLRRHHADPVAPAGLSCVSGGDFCALRRRELSRRPAGAGAVRPRDLLPDCRHGSALLFQPRRAGRIPSGRRSVPFLPTTRQRP